MVTPAEEAQVARGARLRALNRLIVQSDKRAQRRFRRWMAMVERGEQEGRSRAWEVYIQAEDLHSDLMRSRNGRVEG